MSSMNSIEREQKKRQLKRRIVEPGRAAGGTDRKRPGYSDREDEERRKAAGRTRRRRRRLLLVLAACVAAAAACVVLYSRRRQYTEYTVAWEKEIPASESSFTEYIKFGENILKYTKDGATYLDRFGNAVWSLSYQLKAPICYVNGDYAVIADQQGNSMFICDKTGCQGEATTLLPILRVSVSAHGVVAALVEDSTASYVTFFKKDGSALDWGIKTIMSSNGYIMDVSLSPSGTQVMISSVYVQGGMLKNRIVFYNFSEYGKSYSDRLVGGFEEFNDCIAPRVRFLDEEHACIFADGQLGFFLLENVTSPELAFQIPVEGEIQSVAYSDQYVAVISDQPNGEYDSRLDLYSSAGELIFGRDFTYPWQKMEIDRDFIILYNDRSCRIYSAAGKERFSGEFDFTVSMITRGRQPNSLIITGGDRMREIRLK